MFHFFWYLYLTRFQNLTSQRKRLISSLHFTTIAQNMIKEDSPGVLLSFIKNCLHTLTENGKNTILFLID